MRLQGIAVAGGVVHLEESLLGVRGIRGGRKGGWHDGEIGLYMEEAAERLQRHAGGVRLPVRRIARNVGRAQKYPLQQFGMHIGLVLPRVDDGIADGPLPQRLQQRPGLYHLAARSVDDKGLAAQGGKEAGIRQVEGLIRAAPVQRRVEGNDVAFARQHGQVRKARLAPVGARGVVQQHPHAQRARHPLDAAPHMAHAHNAQAGALQVQPLPAFQQQQHRVQILLHTARVASGTVLPHDARPAAIVRVDVVEADGGGGDELHPAALQQGAVT